MDDRDPALFTPAVRAAAGQLLERLLNRALALDPDALARQRRLAGQSVELHLDGPQLALRVSAGDDGRLQVGRVAEDPGMAVHATPGVLLAIALDSRHEVPPGKLRIAGDAGLARQVEALVKAWQPDIEAALAGVFGDVAGVHLARTLHGVLQGARRGLRQAREDAAAWARDEARLSPSRGEVDDWMDAVDTLAEAGERLERRVSRLEAGA